MSTFVSAIAVVRLKGGVIDSSEGRGIVSKVRCRDASDLSRLDDDRALISSIACCVDRAEEFKGDETGMGNVDQGVVDAVVKMEVASVVFIFWSSIDLCVVDAFEEDRALIFSITSCVDLAGALACDATGVDDSEQVVIGAVSSNDVSKEEGEVVAIVSSTFGGCAVDAIDAHRALIFSITSCVDRGEEFDGGETEISDAEHGAIDPVLSNDVNMEEAGVVVGVSSSFGRSAIDANDNSSRTCDLGNGFVVSVFISVSSEGVVDKDIVVSDRGDGCGEDVLSQNDERPHPGFA